MKKVTIFQLIIPFILLFLPSLLFTKNLYILFIDEENMVSFNRYINDLTLKKKDLFLFVDSSNSQLIFRKKLKDGNMVRRYSQKSKFFNLFYKKFDGEHGHINFRDGIIKELTSFQLLNNEPNDFARQLKMVKESIESYHKNYKNITVIFFGNSALHNAYGHNFNLGVPTDGMVYGDTSEFNTIEDIDAKGAKFAIFYDIEPNSTPEMYRFYKKLFKKKFSIELQSFNKNSTFGLAEDLKEDNGSAFFPNIVDVIREKRSDDCGEHDKIIKNDLVNVGKIEVEIINICRKNSILSFSYNGEKSQIIVDGDGRAKKRFKKIKGKNILQYIDLNGEWKEIYNDNVMPLENELIFDFDSATMRVHVIGNNPLRSEGSQFQLNYTNIGAVYNLTVKDGKFEKYIPLESGENIFKWKDMQGKKHHEIITFYPKCTDRVDYNKSIAIEYGILDVVLKNSCREDGSVVQFNYADKHYSAVIDNGEAKLRLILKYDINEIFYQDFNGNSKKIASITIRDFSDLIRFKIRYQDNVAIYEHIYETGVEPTKPVRSLDYRDRTLDKEGHLHINHTQSLKGMIMITEQPTFENLYTSKFIQNYQQVYISRKSKQGKGKISFYLDYASRHGTMYASTGEIKAPLCNERSLGGVVVEYEILIDGTSQLGKKFLNPSRCINNHPTNEDSELIFIKEVTLP